ncbi:MAG TPA: TetR/AcrR family transcriptional regulator [Hydrogenophaga sp.]|nr:TetR/AcrR family transcriptional regulator [Hydrogenophaga sp.]
MSPRIFPDRVARRTQADRSETTRQQLILATIDVVRERAFHGASVVEVSKSAGVTPGAFQHHFGSKAELMMEVVEEILRGDEIGTMRWPDSSRPLPERARATIEGLWHAVYEPDRFLVAWQVYFGCATDPVLLERMQQMRASAGKLIAERFMETFPELDRRADAQAQVGLILSTLRGLGLMRVFGDNPQMASQLEALVNLLIERCQPPPSGISFLRKRRTS